MIQFWLQISPTGLVQPPTSWWFRALSFGPDLQASSSTCSGAIVGVELEASHWKLPQIKGTGPLVGNGEVRRSLPFKSTSFFGPKSGGIVASVLQVIYSSFGKVGNPQMKVVGARMSHQSQPQCRRNTKSVAIDKSIAYHKKRIGSGKYDNGPGSLARQTLKRCVLRLGVLAYTLSEPTKKYAPEQETIGSSIWTDMLLYTRWFKVTLLTPQLDIT